MGTNLLQESMEKLPVNLQEQILILLQDPAALKGIRVSPGEQYAGTNCMKPPTLQSTEQP